MSSFSHTIQSPESHGRSSGGKPSFCSRNTSDRLQESLREGSRSLSMPPSNIKPLRKSAFKEIGLDDLNSSIHKEYQPAHNDLMPIPSLQKEKPKAKGITFDDILKDIDTQELKESKTIGNPLLSKMGRGSRPMIKTTASAPPSTFPTLSRIALIACLIAIVLPSFLGGKDNANIGAADAGVIPNAELVDNASSIQGRANSPTTVCTRWSHQTAVVNGTLYIYGGQATASSSQTSNTWNNDFLTMDLTKTWQISSPSLAGLPQPSGPPAVSNGYLWHSLEALFLYGGEFSDSPSTSPVPMAMWKYDISSATWTEYSSPQTSAGNNSDGGGQPIQRAAEGAGLTIPELGKSYYFGGHLDLYTTEGWSNQIARVYLKSLLEFTHPGYANTGVSSLGSTTGAGSGGVYRNITQGGLQADAGFTERADGVLVYVPGWGVDGIMLGLAGGTNETFTEMNVIDIYDIATSTWYKQSTSGTSPPIRVDPCAVVAAAPDGSSFNVYLYGGQNLIPYGSQIQYSDMWILTIPSFTWIQVDMDGQSEPPARAGHTCNLYDSQMVVVGGYVGNISCDNPGIYVFNASSLQWVNSYTPLSNPSSSTTGSSGSSSSSSSGTYGGSDILQGSIGYQVPDIVQSIIGGSSLGGASVTTPAAGSATAGPFATGRPPTFTVTESGQTVSATATATSKTTSTSTSNPQTSSKKSGPNIGAMVAGTIAGALALLAGYLAFCSWLYRKQLRLYKNHVAMAQRTAFAQGPENQWNPSDESGATRVNEKAAGPAGGTVLGAFGTAIAGRGSVSTGRPSYGGGNSGPSAGSTPGNDSGEETTEGENRIGSYSGYGGGYGGGIMPGGGTAGIGYGRLSEEDETEYHGAGNMAYGHSNWGRPRPLGSTTNSSAEDLLGGQEPSFFSVVLNPRRTLKVVNQD